jgi:hypothetical protein
MPYKVIKVKSGYKVKNMDTGKTYEKKPIPKAHAEAQRRLLEAIKHKTLKPRPR